MPESIKKNLLTLPEGFTMPDFKGDDLKKLLDTLSIESLSPLVKDYPSRRIDSIDIYERGRKIPQDPYVQHMQDLCHTIRSEAKDTGVFERVSERDVYTDTKWGECHQSFKMILTGDDKSIEHAVKLFEAIDSSFIINDSEKLFRVATCAKYLLAKGDFSNAAKLMDAAQFSIDEKQFVIGVGLEQYLISANSSYDFMFKTGNIKSQEPTDLSQTFSLTKEQFQSAANPAYFKALKSLESFNLEEMKQIVDAYLEGSSGSSMFKYNKAFIPRASMSRLQHIRTLLDPNELLTQESESLAIAISNSNIEGVKSLLQVRKFSLTEDPLARRISQCDSFLRVHVFQPEKSSIDLSYLVSRLEVPESISSDRDLREKAQIIAAQSLKTGEFQKYSNIDQAFNFSVLPRTAMAESYVAAGILRLFSSYASEQEVTDYISRFKPSQEAVCAEFIKGPEDRTIKYSLGVLERADKAGLISGQDRQNPDLIRAAKSQALEKLARGQDNDLELFLSIFKINQKIKGSKQLLMTASEGINSLLKQGGTEKALELFRKFQPAEKDISGYLVSCIIKATLDGKTAFLTGVSEINSDFYPLELKKFQGFLDKQTQYVLKLLAIETTADIENLCKTDAAFIGYLNKNNSQSCNLSSQMIKELRAAGLGLLAAELFLESQLDLSILTSSKRLQSIVETLKLNSQTEVEDLNNLILAIKTFGSQNTEKYLTPIRLVDQQFNPHTALMSMQGVVNLFRASALSQNEFFNNILDQVRRDNAHFDTGDSFAYFGQLASNVNLDVDQVITSASKFPELQVVQDLSQEFAINNAAVWDSWGSFQRYCKLYFALQRGELIQDIEEQRKAGRADLAEFVELLGFHPTSKINYHHLKKFVNDPKSFMTHTISRDSNINYYASPIAYTHTGFLDLSAEDLRDAIASSKLDQTQEILPYSIRLEVPVNATKYSSLRQSLALALGNRQLQVQGEAKDPKRLFHQVSQVLKSVGSDPKKFIDGQEIPVEQQRELMSLIFKSEFGINESLHELVISIHPKSNPYGMLAGDDTACCMPWGSDKNTAYMFNPACAIFTIQLQRQEGGFRTVTQSLLRLDRHVSNNVVASGYLPSDQQRIQALFAEEDLVASLPLQINCDNAEPNKNYTDSGWQAKNLIAYQEFFRLYLAAYADQLNLIDDHVAIGMGYSLPFVGHSILEPNKFVPTVLIPYSDMSSSEVYKVITTESAFPATIINAPDYHEVNYSERLAGIHPLQIRDIHLLSALEAKVYENSALKEGLFELQRTVVSAHIANKLKDRPNLSLVSLDSNSKLSSYLIAYESKGRLEGSRDEIPFVYVADLASDPKAHGAGLKLMDKFIENYLIQYPNSETRPVIVADMREQTTFGFFKRRIDKIATKLNLKVEMQVLGADGAGESKRHKVIIKIQ